MNKRFKLLGMFLVIISVLGIQSCQNDEFGNAAVGAADGSSLELKSASINTFYSSTVPVGNGVARAWIKVNKINEPLEVGINLSEKALQNLPDEPKQYVLMLPKNKGNNFYTHVLFDWNPHGHEPEGVYDSPHFDFHFYIISNDARMSIGPDDFDEFANAPATQYVPSNYWQIPGGVPQMGAHWVDLESPEFNGGTFTHTFIWGSYDGEFIFWEPMITEDYLLGMPDESFDIRQPAEFQKDGWYPTEYKISYSTNPKEYTIALTKLVHYSEE